MKIINGGQSVPSTLYPVARTRVWQPGVCDFTGYWILSTGLFALRTLTVQNRSPVCAIGRHLKLKRVGRRRQNLLAEPARPGWFHAADPGPGVAVHGSLGDDGLALTVEFVIRVLFFVGIVPEEGDPVAITHAGALELGMNDNKETPIHPLRVIGHGHLAPWPHGA